MEVFTITAPETTVELDESRQGRISFTVSNITGRPLEGRARLEAKEPAQESWYTVEGDVQRSFGPDESHQFTVKVQAPGDAPAGRTSFRLAVDSVENPDEDFAEGPEVAVKVPGTEDDGGGFPMWILAVVGGVLLVGGIVWLLIAQPWEGDGGDGDAGLTADIAVACTGLECDFDGTGSSSSDGEIEGYEWSFGDGTSGTGEQVTHSYGSAGSFEVTLTVSDDEGGTGTITETLDVAPLAGGGDALDEDCLRIPSGARIQRRGSGWILTDASGSRSMIFFQERDEARRALRTIRHYQMTQHCFVGRPDPSGEYFLVGDAAPQGSMPGEDCIGFDPSTLRIQREGSRWLMRSSTSRMAMFPDEDEARKMLDVIRKYGFNEQCFIGRPDPSVSYWRR